MGCRGLIFLVPFVLTACPPVEVGPFPKDPVTPCEDIGACKPIECEQVCDHLKALGCPEGGGTPAGENCVEVCRHLDLESFEIDKECLAYAKTCKAAEQC